jgi:hypothetical protein
MLYLKDCLRVLICLFSLKILYCYYYFQNLIGKVEAGVETAATAAAISLPDLEAVALGLDTLRHNLPVSGQLKGL